MAIHVQFIDATGELVAESQVPAESLPESFEAQTTVSLQGQDWAVIAAAPMTRADATTSGTLRLTVERMDVQQVSIQDLWYTLPTIGDALPALTGTKLGKRTLELHEDDWRQIELVSDAYLDAVKEDLAAIEAIHRTASTDGLFRTVHLRRAVPAPLLDGALTVAALRAALAPVEPYDGVSVRDCAGMVDGGFAFRARGFDVYGTERGGLATCVGLMCGANPEPAMAALLTTHHLVLVDWCQTEVVTGAR